MDNIQLANIQHIQNACKQDKLVIFIGAGISANSGVPMWKKLIESLKKELPTELMEETDELKIAQLYKDSRGYKEYIEKIKDVLMYGKSSPNPIHDVLLDLKPCHIITTNYDNLIEQSVLRRFKQYYIIRKDADLPYIQYQNTVVKMHGDFETDNIVLTESDYYNYSENFPLIQSFVQSLFATKLVLFVGFSFNDINLKFILNRVSNILRENMQRVYLLANNDIDPIQRAYYENKGINVVNINQEEVASYLYKYHIKDKSSELVSQVGKSLYRQLVFIKHFRKEQDLIEYMYDYISSYKDEIRVLGDGFKYIIPQNEQLGWTYSSSGLHIESSFIKGIKKQLKTFAGRRKFVIQYKEHLIELRKQAYLNRFFSINNLKLVNKTFYRHLNEYIPQQAVDDFYDLDYINLYSKIRLLRSKGYQCNINDLEFPFILYKLGDYYQAYLIYRDLANITWKYKKYILYFICVYNMYSIRYGIQKQLIEREDVDTSSILEDIDFFDLPSILNKLPIDTGIKHVFEDLLSYRFHGDKLVESENLKEKITNQRKSAERGGVSMNSNIYSLESKFYQIFDFCNDNYIICDNNRFSNTLYYNTIVGILNSHVTLKAKKNAFLENTRIEELEKEHLLLLFFHINNKELLEIFKQYDIKTIVLSQNACEYLARIIKNIEQTIAHRLYKKYIVDWKDLLMNIILNMIAVVNRMQNKIPEVYKMYSAINYMWNAQYFLSFNQEISIFTYKYKPELSDAVLLLEHLVFRGYKHDKIYQAIFNLSQVLKEQVKTIESIHDIEDIPDKEDPFFVSSFFSVLNVHVQKEVIMYFKQSIHDLYTLLMIHENYQIPILEEETLRKAISSPDFSDDTYVEKEVFSCAVLARIRRNNEYQSLYGLIDNFAVKNECLQFFLNPIKFEKIGRVQPVWVCFCEDKIIKALLKNRIIKEKVKEFITSDVFGKLRFDRIWKLL